VLASRGTSGLPAGEDVLRDLPCASGHLAACGVGVVIGVGLPQMLCLSVGVGLVIVFQGRMTVVVGMGGCHGLPLAAVPQVMHHVSVLVSVTDGVMGVLHGDLLVTLLRIREPAGGVWLGKAGRGGAGIAESGPPLVGSCCSD